MSEDKTLLIFNNTRNVVIAEKECKKNGFECIAVPIPREYSSKCGIALQINSVQFEEINSFLNTINKPCEIFDINNKKHLNQNKSCSL